jgi:3-deoxy-D-manno-octulosonic-acid transferase
MTSAAPLVRLLLQAGRRVVTTHATPAGRAIAEELFAAEIDAGQLAVRYAPIDVARYWRAFFAGTTPRVGLVMEMEFWPAMIEAAANADVSLCLANSQIPSRSLARARRMKTWAGAHPCARAAAVFAKSDRMAQRFSELGQETVLSLGETRFDIPPPPTHIAAGDRLKTVISKQTVTLASVVEGEEDTYIRALKSLPEAPFIIWVPRAPELFEATCDRLKAAGFRIAKRDELFDSALNQIGDLGEIDILVGNSVGEMFFYLQPADAVVVGGGFVEKGAHNVIEPLALGKPVVAGPHVWTIEYPGVEAQEAEVLHVCAGAGDLPGAIEKALASPPENALAFHAANVGASQRIFDIVEEHLERQE